MENRNRKPDQIRLTGKLDLDLSKKGISPGEEFTVDAFNEKTGACYIKDRRIDAVYPFVVYPGNYEIIVFAKTSYLSEKERAFKEELEALKIRLDSVQTEIEKTCPDCKADKHKQLSAQRTEIRKEITLLNKSIKTKKKGKKIR